MKQKLLLFLLIFGISNISFAQLSLSLIAKGNYGFGNIQERIQSSNQEDVAGLRLRVADSFMGPNSSIEVRVRPAFEIGVEGGLPLNKRISAIFGLNIQQVRVEAIPATTTINSPIGIGFPESTFSQVYYLKIPLLLEIDLYKNKLFVQAGIYAASKFAYHHKELDRKASNPLVFETNVPADEFLEINSSDQFNSLLFGFQTGIKYQFWKKMSIDMSYSHSLNNFFDEESFLNMNLNNFSFGLQWRLM